MAISTTSLGKLPPNAALAGAARTNALLLVVSAQIQNMANDWAKISSASVLFEPPVAQDARKGGLLDSLPWPLMVTEVSVQGELQGTYYMLLQVHDAMGLAAMVLETDPPAKGTPPDPMSLDAAHEMFNIGVGASDRAMARGKDERVRLKQVHSKILASPQEMGEFGARPNGWLVEIKSCVGAQAFRLWLVFPEQLGTDMAEYYREEQSSQVSVPCGARADAPTRGGKRGKVIVIDSAQSVRNAIQGHLEKEGFQVLHAASAEQGLLLVRNEVPKMVILDIALPDQNGFDVCRKLRTVYDKARLPVLFCSSRAQREDILEAIRAGGNDYIMKPFTKDVLLGKVNAALGSIAARVS